MSDQDMKLEDVLKYAIRVENESCVFYTNAANQISGEAVKSLLIKLQQEEVRHEDRLTNILLDIDKEASINISTDSLNRLITTSEIPLDATEKVVLEIALEREKSTRDFYRQVATLTNLDASVVEVFNMLFDQESGHVTRVSNMLNRL